MALTINGDFDNQMLTRVIREVIPDDGIPSLEAFLPDENVRARSFKIKTYDKVEDVATYRAYDTPSPVAPRVGFTERTGKLPPISRANVIGEDEELGRYERIIAGDWDPEIEGDIYNDAVKLAEAIRNRVEFARGEALETGTFTIAENDVEAVADFGRAGGNASTVATAWSSVATATPLDDIRAIWEQSGDEQDVRVTRMLCSTQVISWLLFNQQIRDMLQVAGISPDLVTLGSVNQLLSNHRLPQIIEYDRSINGTRVLTEDVVIFLPPNSERLGSTKWGTTAESIKLQLDRSEAPGLTGVVMDNDHPVQSAVNVSAIVMPVLPDPDLVYTLDVVP